MFLWIFFLIELRTKHARILLRNGKSISWHQNNKSQLIKYSWSQFIWILIYTFDWSPGDPGLRKILRFFRKMENGYWSHLRIFPNLAKACKSGISYYLSLLQTLFKLLRFLFISVGKISYFCQICWWLFLLVQTLRYHYGFKCFISNSPRYSNFENYM